MKKNAKGESNGTAIKNIPPFEILNNYVIPLPPLAEQKRIVAKLEELLPLVEEYAEYYDQLQKLNQEFPGKLKKALLQFAIEGKLVPQDKSEGTGADLLQKIRKENPPRRNRGQEKRHPSESEGLSVGAVTAKVNSPSNGRGGPILERGPAGWVEEQPFAIPDNWCWCRLGEIVDLISGQDLEPTCYNAVGNGIPYITGASCIDNGRVLVKRWTTAPKSVAIGGDILLTCKGTVGKLAILQENKVHIARQIMAIKVMKSDLKGYILYFLRYYVDKFCQCATGIIPGIARADVLEAVVPLPPLAEQKRIVAKLEELLPLCESLESR